MVPSELKDKHILLGVTGGIAAYKIPLLVRLLTAAGAKVRVIMTASATAFVTPCTLETLSGHQVYQDTYQDPMAHIALARWADILLIAPATAQVLAKMAHGLADDLLTTLCLAIQVPVVVAPSMNQQMWQHAATQANLQCLLHRGVVCLQPESGIQACGEYGPGRMPAPDQLKKILLHQLCRHEKGRQLQGKNLVITAGPTQEPMDAVRYLSNHSSGKMAYELAYAALSYGAVVTVISGPTQLSPPLGAHYVPVTTGEQMHAQAMTYASKADIFMGVAAVVDFKPEEVHTQKIKKKPHQKGCVLALVPNPDIVASVAAMSQHRPWTVGFAAETQDLEQHAREKMHNKGLDLIIANQVGNGLGFHADDNEALAVWPSGQKKWPRQTKSQLAHQILCLLVGLMP